MVKANKVKILVFIWSVSVFVTFIAPLKIYPVFFVVFIASFCFLVNKETLKLDYRTANIFFLIILLILVFLLSGFSGMFELDFFSIKDNIKVFINFLWLTSSIVFFYVHKDEILENVLIVERTFLLIIYLSCFQLFIKIALLNLWLVPFDGSNTSSQVSYVLDNVPTIFGDTNKNIFSTKVIFILIITISARVFHFFTFKRYEILVMIGLVFSVYSMSRTGQVVFVLFFLLLVIRSLNITKRKKYLKPFLFLFFFALSYLGVMGALNSFFHLDLSNSNNDGFSARLILWALYFQNVGRIEILGSGAYSSSEILRLMINRDESNFHNVFMNLSFEIGWLGFLLYIVMLVSIFSFTKSKVDKPSLLLLVLPFIACVNSQYTGYSADEIIYLANSFNLVLFIKGKKLKDD